MSFSSCCIVRGALAFTLLVLSSGRRHDFTSMRLHQEESRLGTRKELLLHVHADDVAKFDEARNTSNFGMLQGNATAPLKKLQDLMQELFPQRFPSLRAWSTRTLAAATRTTAASDYLIPQARVRGRACRGPYPSGHRSAPDKDGWTMQLLWPGCFHKMRDVFGSSDGFAEAVTRHRRIGS